MANPKASERRIAGNLAIEPPPNPCRSDESATMTSGMHPIMLVSEVVLDPAIGGAWFEGGPAIVYDGLGVETEGSATTVTTRCLGCDTALVVDLARCETGVVLWRLMSEPWSQAVIDAFRLVRRGEGELAAICDGMGLDTYLLTPVCGVCSAQHAVVLGYGEFQPARYLGTYLGIARARYITRAT
jgi:hypothetical protein